MFQWADILVGVKSGEILSFFCLQGGKIGFIAFVVYFLLYLKTGKLYLKFLYFNVVSLLIGQITPKFLQYCTYVPVLYSTALQHE